MRRRLVGFWLALCFSGMAASCRKDESPRARTGLPEASYGVVKKYGAGPVTFTIELSAWAITTADSLKCRMTLETAAGHEAEFPDLAIPEDMPGAILTGFEEHQSTRGDRKVVQRAYEIEPEFEGTLTLPRLEVYHHRAGEVKEEVLETDPLELTVKSHGESAGELELKPFRGPVTVDQMEAQRRRLWPWIAGMAAGLVGVAVLAVYLVRRPRRVPPPPPAHETALKRLRELAGRGLIAAGAGEAFFVEVTGIVRDYIEEAFGLHAPEQTTEEFLAGLTTAPAVMQHRNVLEAFLTAADEVKFACMKPDTQTMQRAFATAESFVLQSSVAREQQRREPATVAAG